MRGKGRTISGGSAERDVLRAGARLLGRHCDCGGLGISVDGIWKEKGKRISPMMSVDIHTENWPCVP